MAAAVDAARRTVDAREMAAVPRCELDPLHADFGDVMFAQEKRLRLLLRNVGQVIFCHPNIENRLRKGLGT